MRVATAIRHVHFEDLGVFEDVLTECGLDIRYVEAGIPDAQQSPGLEDHLLIVLGGPIGACEEDRYPFLSKELELIDTRLVRGLPTLGICLGAQLMARALGANVYPAPAREIGWGPITLTDQGLASPLRCLGAPGMAVLHWHGDTFDLPRGVTLLASTEVCANQAFACKGIGLALQFHPEVRHQEIEHWLIGHALELAQSRVDLDGLRADSMRYGRQTEACARAAFKEWLESVALWRTSSGRRVLPT